MSGIRFPAFGLIMDGIAKGLVMDKIVFFSQIFLGYWKGLVCWR